MLARGRHLQTARHLRSGPRPRRPAGVVSGASAVLSTLSDLAPMGRWVRFQIIPLVEESENRTDVRSGRGGVGPTPRTWEFRALHVLTTAPVRAVVEGDHLWWSPSTRRRRSAAIESCGTKRRRCARPALTNRAPLAQRAAPAASRGGGLRGNSCKSRFARHFSQGGH